jgi:hypothetical protein
MLHCGTKTVHMSSCLARAITFYCETEILKFRISKIHNVLDIKLIFLKLWIFTNFNTVFPVLVLVFVFEEFSEEVLHRCYMLHFIKPGYFSIDFNH